MTVVLTGFDLTIDELVRVARHGEAVVLGDDVVERMQASREVVERVLDREDTVYGLNTGLGVLKRAKIPRDEIAGFQHRTLGLHALAGGPEVTPDIGRTLVLRQLNSFATGSWGVRPALAEFMVEYLNNGGAPTPRQGASLHMGAGAALEMLGDFTLDVHEALPLLNMGGASGPLALAFADAVGLRDAMEVSAAFAFEAFAGQSNHLHPAVAAVRPYPGFMEAAARMRNALEGSFIWNPGAARNLQDPVSFRSISQVAGTLRATFDYAQQQIEAALNGMAGNPIVVVEEDRMISAANWDGSTLAIPESALSLALNVAFIASQERSIKQLDELWSGLPTGLTPEAAIGESGLSMHQMTASSSAQSAAALMAGVALHDTTSSQAEGIEDFGSGPSVARLIEMTDIGYSLVALELLVSAQAVQLRGETPLGHATTRLLELVREIVPFARGGEKIMSDLTPLKALARSGAVSDLVAH